LAERILGIGITTVDLISEVAELPRPDEHQYMLGFERQVGGLVGNAVAAAARLGAKTAWIGKVGDDDNGRFVIDEMKREGVDVSRVIAAPGESTPFSIILSDRKTGGRSIVCNPGCSESLGEQIPDDALAGFDALHIDGYFADAALPAVRRARKLGLKISIDPSPRFTTLLDFIENIDIFIVGRAAAEALTGETDPEVSAGRLAALGPEIAGVTLGSEGCVCVAKGELVRTPAFKVKAVDTTAAGDTFHGAFLVGCLKGWPLEKTMLFASAASAVKCTVPGGRKGMPRFDAVVRFLAERGVEI